ncbi:hypothetical protein, partial [Chromohalobacter israelensis]|uniref:hypothetical protein n=1 Tax=Chromohalobacter israelensis TaxID=141390 RepID=UPI001C6426C5
LVLVFGLGERDLLHRVARSGGDRVARFYPADGDQAAAAGFMQRFLKSALFNTDQFFFCLSSAMVCMSAREGRRARKTGRKDA